MFANAQVTFQKTYGSTNGEIGKSMRQTIDGDLIITGNTSSFGAGNSDVYIIRTNSDGTIQWTKTYGGTNDEGGNSIQQTNDGGFIIAGFTNTFGMGNHDVYLLKILSDGTLQWAKTYGGTGSDIGNSVQQTNDGGFIICGNTYSFGAGAGDIYLIKTDSDGILQWTKTFGEAATDNGFSVLQTNDSGYIICGSPKTLLIKVTSNGSFNWGKNMGVCWDPGYSIKQLNNGEFIIAGEICLGAGNTDVSLLKIDSSGTLLWAKTFGGTAADSGYDVQQTSDGGFIVVGETRSFGWPYYVGYLIKTISDGSLQWSKSFGVTYDNNFSRSVYQTNDSGFIIAGSSKMGLGIKYHFYLHKTDINGNTGCNENNPNTIVTSPTIPTSNAQLQIYSGGVEGNPATQVGSGGFAITFCNNALVTTISNTNISCFANCDGTATLNASAGTPPYTYLWSDNQTTQTATGLCAGSYTGTVTDAVGATKTATVVLAQPAVVSISVLPASICIGGCVTLISNATGGDGIYSYQWLPGNMTTNAILVCPSVQTDYTVTVTNSCGNDTAATTVMVNSLPSVSLSLNPDTVCISVPSYSLTGGSPSGGIYSGAGVSAGNFNPSVAGSGLHNIIYTYTDANSCTSSDTMQIYVDLCTGVQTFLNSESISISPNPTSGVFTIQSSEHISSIEITNLLGEILCQSQYSIPNTQYSLDLSKRQRGIYFVKVFSEKGIVTKKLVLQ